MEGLLLGLMGAFFAKSFRKILYLIELPPVGLSVGLGPSVVWTMGAPLGPKVGPEVELLHLQNFFLGKHFSGGLSNTAGPVFAGS